MDEQAYERILVTLAGIVNLADRTRYTDLPQVVRGLVQRHDAYERMVRERMERDVPQIQSMPAFPHMPELALDALSAPSVEVHIHIHTGGDPG
jgi:hypothetical protein